MQSMHSQRFKSATQPYPMFFGYVGCVVLGLYLCSCSSIPHAYHAYSLEETSALSLRYSMIFIIHGDGDYLYHDLLGRAHRADEMAFAGALKVALRNPLAEVFIFCQKSRKHALVFFPLRDGEFYYYRHGRLLAKESYRRNQGTSRFDPEVELYHRFHANEQSDVLRLFLYFGHEIPEFNGAGYDASYSDHTFTVHDLADGIKRLEGDSTKVDLLVLSTCFNGTPYTIAALAPYVHTIVASPENLHLSYFDIHPFEQLDVGLQDGNVPAFASRFARQAFDLLTKEIQTTVTVAVYDVERVRGYLNSVNRVNENIVSILEEQPPGSAEHCDCAEKPEYALPGMNQGVEVFYRSPSFGRSKHKPYHSGWECYMLPK
jgi:hypothetical protein